MTKDRCLLCWTWLSVQIPRFPAVLLVKSAPWFDRGMHIVDQPAPSITLSTGCSNSGSSFQCLWLKRRDLNLDQQSLVSGSRFCCSDLEALSQSSSKSSTFASSTQRRCSLHWRWLCSWSFLLFRQILWLIRSLWWRWCAGLEYRSSAF